MALHACPPNTQGLRQEDHKLKASLENVVRLSKMKLKLKVDVEQRWHSSFQCIILLIFIAKVLKCDGQLGNQSQTS